MIRYLSGTIIENSPLFITLENNGLGYQVYIPETVHAKKTGVMLAVWVADIVREDSHDLYGFLSETDLQLFELITSVSGVGPKLGANMVHHAGNGIIRAIGSHDIGYLSSLPGIGKKTAEKIVLELRDKVSHFGLASLGTSSLSSHQDVIDGLVALGFAERTVRELLLSIDTTDKDTQTIIKEIIKFLR